MAMDSEADSAVALCLGLVLREEVFLLGLFEGDGFVSNYVKALSSLLPYSFIILQSYLGCFGQYSAVLLNINYQNYPTELSA